MDLPIFKTHVSTTKESPSRCELTGVVEIATGKHRLHIFTLTDKHTDHEKIVRDVAATIESKGLSKREALQLRNKMI